MALVIAEYFRSSDSLARLAGTLVSDYDRPAWRCPPPTIDLNQPAIQRTNTGIWKHLRVLWAHFSVGFFSIIIHEEARKRVKSNKS
jgi:hypothetical protein